MINIFKNGITCLNDFLISDLLELQPSWGHETTFLNVHTCLLSLDKNQNTLRWFGLSYTSASQHDHTAVSQRLSSIKIISQYHCHLGKL